MPLPVERTVEPSEAISALLPLLVTTAAQLDFSLRNLDSIQEYVDVPVRMVGRETGVVVTSRGKGRGTQALASGLYELLEHAVFHGLIGHIEPERYRLEDSDRVLSTNGADVALDVAATSILPGDPCYAFRPVSRVHAPQGTGQQFLVPAYLSANQPERPLGQAERRAAHYYTTNGWASGSTVDEALLHALNELIERDALSSLLLHSLEKGSAIVEDGYRLLASKTDARLPVDLRVLKQGVESVIGTDVALLRIPSIVGFTFLAISAKAYRDDSHLVGAGTSLDPRYAAERALTELAQEHAEDSAESQENSERSARLALLALQRPRLSEVARLTCLHYVDPAAGVSDWSLSVADPSISGQLNHIVENLQYRGGVTPIFRIAYAQRRNEAVGDYAVVVHAIAPGLERFHLIRDGLVVEPTGRLRTRQMVMAVRKAASASEGGR